MATATTITVRLGELRADVLGTERYVGTATGGAGIPNVERYDCEIGGHQVDGHWGGDGRHGTTVCIGADHPLAAAVRLIAAAQDARRDYLDCRDRSAPVGYRPAEWRRVQSEAEGAWGEAARRLAADAVASSIAAM